MLERQSMSNAPLHPPASSLQPPSRHDNPFATCWTKPGALRYHFSDGESAEYLVSQLASRSWCGAIVGPHGSGKSTLLEALKPALAEAGCQVVSVSLHDGERRLPTSVWNDLKCASEPHSSEPLGSPQREKPAGSLSNLSKPQRLLIIDGYEQLSCFQRWRFTRYCRGHGIGVLVTSHTPVNFPTQIPTLITIAPDRALVLQLVADLTSEVSIPITPEDVAASHACHGSNVREIFFDLYDRHEQRRR